MQWLNSSWQVGRFRGVEIRLHISMLLVILLVAGLSHPQGALEWLRALLVMVGVFVSVLLHEIGHTLAAQRFGIAVRNIILWPLGGLTNLSRQPEKPAHNLLISAAGPLVNLFLMLALGALWLIQWVFGGLTDFAPGEFISELILSLMFMNLFLAVFNVLPIYPLDGGGVLHSLMEMLFSKPAANTISILIGIPFLLGLVVWGIFIHDYFLLFICLLLALGIGTLNPRSRRWVNLGLAYLFKRTGYYLLNGDFDEAIQAYTRALEENPRDLPSLLGRAMAYLNIAEIDLARADLESLLEAEPENVTALEFQGEIHGLNKEYEVALDLYARVKTLKPGWGLPYFDCGAVYLDQKRYEPAMRELDRAIELLPETPLFYLVRSMAHYRLGNLVQAHQDQASALRLSPRDALTVSEVNLEIYKDNLDWAQDYYGWVLEKYPRQWLAYQGRADAHLVNGEPASAIADYDLALELAPKEAALYLRRGIAYQKAGNVTQAAGDFRSAQVLARKSHLRRRAGQLLEGVGRTDG